MERSSILVAPIPGEGAWVEEFTRSASSINNNNINNNISNGSNGSMIMKDVRREEASIIRAKKRSSSSSSGSGSGRDQDNSKEEEEKHTDTDKQDPARIGPEVVNQDRATFRPEAVNQDRADFPSFTERGIEMPSVQPHWE